MRGEKPYDVYLLLREAGSPPHARGKAYGIYKACQRIGITPACAGKRYHEL